jgi:2-amino-4-hydroxy-6-hydroxymethyldihydropteridine diphosphokinase
VKNLLPHQVFLGLGSNLGNRVEHIRNAITLIDERVGHLVRQSSLIASEPWGFESANKFLNAVILCETDMTPREVLGATQQIERDMGRQKIVHRTSSNRTYTDRPIDIDILLYDDLTVDEPDLMIPHPLMEQRDFVMMPLKEILQ